MYLLSKLAWAVAEPSMALLLVLMSGLLLLVVTPTSRLGWRLLISGAAALAICAILPLGTWLLRPLEERFPAPPKLREPVTGIVLLGGAIDVATSLDHGQPTFNPRAARVFAFLSLAKRYPRATLLFTGGDASILPFHQGSEADVMRQLTARLGLSQRVMFEQQSRNTRENALYSRRLVHLKPGQHWLLITSAADMSRAVGCFRGVGWPVTAVPVDYHTRRNDDDWIPGLMGGLEQIDWATHEWLGLLYYRLRGWTPSLFPGPD